MDIARPGESAPSSSARPIVVSHKPMIEDPMMRTEPSSVPGAPPMTKSGAKLTTRKATIALKPLDAEEKDAETDEGSAQHKPLVHHPGTVVTPEQATPDTPKAPSESGQTPAPDEQEQEPKDDTAQEPTKQDAVTDTDKAADEQTTAAADEQPQDAGIVDELAKQAAAKRKQAEEDKNDKVKHDQVNSLIESKTYNVPIGQITKRRHTITFVIMLILVVLVGLIAINFAIDAGMIKTDIKPLTDLIKN